MVIDDSPIDRLLVEKMVRKAEFAEEVISFESAKTALNYFTDNADVENSIPDILFLDINMPEMNGFDFLDACKSLPEPVKSKCRIIMLSSSLHNEDKSRALGHPYVEGFLNKPLTFEVLEALKKK